MGQGDAWFVEHIRRWQGGDRGALDALLQRLLPSIERRVRARLGPALRRHVETGDVVGSFVLRVLRVVPPARVLSADRLEAYFATAVENAIRDQVDYLTAGCRDVDRREPVPSDTVLDLRAARTRHPTPSEVAMEREDGRLVRFGLFLLDASDRRVIVLRDWEGLSFRSCGEALGCSEDAARMRYTRALGRLAARVTEVSVHGEAGTTR